jgi:glyoxylase-like metal-dependent hydrolase (beta-lactamase superfamily II)
MQVKRFTLNAFQENTYILYDETNECVIIDAGNSNKKEDNILTEFINTHELKPKYLLNTHVHIDHILGNKFLNEEFGLIPHFHKEDLFLYESSNDIATMYGLNYSKLSVSFKFIEDEEVINFGNTKLQCILAPGHSPGSICFYNKKDRIIITGDVLFKESIGRSDLPGGNHHQLLASISEKLFTLPDETIAFPGHMTETTIGHEKMYNPFF